MLLILLLAATLASAQRVCDSSFSLPESPDFKVLSLTANPVYNHSKVQLNFCNISIQLEHPGAGDIVLTTLWLPLDKWNGRILTTGGSGTTAGSQNNLFHPVSQGYATAYTDGGLSLNNTIDPNSGTWAFISKDVPNWDLLTNFAYRSNHDTTTLLQSAVRSLYGLSKDAKSYYSGCSTGGRQGYAAAQRYPGDYDGILANAPNLYAPRALGGLIWPPVLMSNTIAPPNCVVKKYQEAIVAACDALDGLIDGLISDPDQCHFDTRKLIGTKIECADTGGSIMVTKEYAQVVHLILRGPKRGNGEQIWFGIPPGADFAGLANTTTIANITTPAPFGASSLFKMILQDPNADGKNLSLEAYNENTQAFSKRFNEILGNPNPNLSAFRNRGGKILSWHGLADQLLTHKGSIQYHNELTQKMGPLDDFKRLFLAPGVGHCGGGVGPQPGDALPVLKAWCERAEVPESLVTLSMNGSRYLCAYPEKLRYSGGDVNLAGSFSCV